MRGIQYYSPLKVRNAKVHGQGTGRHPLLGADAACSV